MSECQEADTLEALSESEVESLEDLQAEFARLREAVVAQHDPTDSLSRLHLQQCLARLSEAEHWAERIVLE